MNLRRRILIEIKLYFQLKSLRTTPNSKVGKGWNALPEEGHIKVKTRVNGNSYNFDSEINLKTGAFIIYNDYGEVYLQGECAKKDLISVTKLLNIKGFWVLPDLLSSIFRMNWLVKHGCIHTGFFK